MDLIRILLVDDHQVVREGVRRMLEIEPDMRVVGEAAGGEEGLTMLETLEPDIVITDVKMPGMDGVEFTRRAKALFPDCNVLMLTLYDEFLSTALEAGAVGYLRKDLQRAELVGAVRSVLEGRSPVHVTLERDQLTDITSGAQRGPQISEREQAVLRLLASGVTTREVGLQLDYSESTVKRTIRGVFEKMGVRNRSEAVAEAIKRGLI
ncbi:MAG: response regulator transcription factor [Chloroflexi bacterium]|nr:response regulator transcription factor [Chloroflexota bacterium]